MTLRAPRARGKDEIASAGWERPNYNERGGNRTHDLKLKRLLL